MACSSEVFFDANGQLRKSFKRSASSRSSSRYGAHKGLAAELRLPGARVLLPQARQFYSVPGKRQEVSVDVLTKQGAKADHRSCCHCIAAARSVLWLRTTTTCLRPARHRMAAPDDGGSLRPWWPSEMVAAASEAQLPVLQEERQEQIHFPGVDGPQSADP